MKLKIKLLIVFSTLILLVLAAMQYYLVKTAYDYKVEELRTEVQKKISKVTDDYSNIDSSIFYKKNLLYKEMVAQYIKTNRRGLKIEDTLPQSEFRDALSGKLQQELKKEFPELKLDFAIVLNKFIMYNGSVPDTLFAQEPRVENTIMGSLTSLDDAFMVRNYAGSLSVNSTNIMTEDTLYIYIHNWQQLIYSRMRIIFLFSAFVMVTLITLFVVAIKALIKQKKISDIKTDFINNITHELKTPLTTLSVSTKILQRPETKTDSDLLDNIVDTISRQNVRLQNLIDQVLVSSLGYEEIELTKEKVEIHNLLQTVCNDFKIANPQIDVKAEYNATNIELTLDTFYLTTAITNVLDNAVKYGCKHITIKTVLEHNLFTVSIEDDGIGISKDKQLLLFDKFYRVPEGNVHNAKGLGLGLYYTNQIIKAHRGSINVISQLGKGAMFNISIPAV
jgi:two-component system sensor histidine kinase VicK